MSKSIIDAQVNKITKRAGMSDEDAKKAADAINAISSKIVIKFLLDFIDNYCANNEHDCELKNKVVSNIKKIPVHNFVGFREVSFKNIPGISWRTQLSIVNKDDEIDLQVPDDKDIIAQIFHGIDHIAMTATAYYQKVIVDNPDIINDLGELIHFNCGRLEINKNNRSMYIDEDYKYRIGVLCYTVGPDGKPFEK